jgi:hypothetical protein
LTQAIWTVQYDTYHAEDNAACMVGWEIGDPMLSVRCRRQCSVQVNK